MKHIVIHPYPCDLYFTRDRDAYTLARASYTSTPCDVSEICGIASDFENGTVHLVGVFDGRLPTLVHEIAHVVIKVFAYVNVPIRPDCSEAFTYLLDDLFSQCNE